MGIDLYLQQLEVARVRPALQGALAERTYSDLVDDHGHQYVDLVMEGGGVLGIALVGYTWAMEQAGVRFLGVAGTSAGAINATLQAGFGPPDAAKAEQILAALAAVDLIDFVDGDGDAKDFVDAVLRKRSRLTLLWKGVQVIDNLCDDLGLNPGKVFHRWLAEQLEAHGIERLEQLQQQLRTLPQLHHRLENRAVDLDEANPKLAVITAEVTTESKITLPEMADLFWADPARVHPADFVRASMSIPFFFHPYRVSHVPQEDNAAQRWNERVGYTGPIPAEALFLDGGILSNFPIGVFHQPGVPSAPTFGAKLGTDRNQPRQIEGPGSLASAMFDAARHVLDFDFFLRNPDYRKLVAVIPTDSFHWLDFKMDEATKAELFATGVVAAHDFLAEFDWEAYKELRAAATESTSSL